MLQYSAVVFNQFWKFKLTLVECIWLAFRQHTSLSWSRKGQRQYKVQYRSKVSCHPLSCFSLVTRDETLVSRGETLVSRESHQNHWSVYFGINYKQLACKKTMNFSRRCEVCPVRASGFSGIVLHAASRETNVDLQAKSLNGKDEKWTSKMITKTQVRLWHHFTFALQHINFA